MLILESFDLIFSLESCLFLILILNLESFNLIFTFLFLIFESFNLIFGFLFCFFKFFCLLALDI